MKYMTTHYIKPWFSVESKVLNEKVDVQLSYRIKHQPYHLISKIMYINKESNNVYCNIGSQIYIDDWN